MTEGHRRPAPRATHAGLLEGLSAQLDLLRDTVERQGQRFQAVLEISAAISSVRDVDELLSLVMDRLTALLGADASSLFVYDGLNNELWSRVLRGSTLKEIRVPTHAGLVGHAFCSGETLVLGNAYSDSRFNPEIDRKSGFRTRSVIATPLRHLSGRILGVVEVLDRTTNAFGADDRLIVEAVAPHLAAVLDNVLLVEQLSEQNATLRRTGDELNQAVRDLDVLFEIEKVVSSSDDHLELLDRVLAKAMASTGASAGGVLQVEDGRGTLHFRSARPATAQPMVCVPVRAGQGICGWVAKSGQPVRLAEATRSDRCDRALLKQLGLTGAAVLCVPIPGEGRHLGAIELWNAPDGFDAADQRLVTLMAGQMGRALQLHGTKREGERRARLAAIGQTLSSLLHDLRTPLTVIGGYAELMVEEADPEERKRSAEIIAKQFEQMNAMVKETLAFARGDCELLVRKIYLQWFIGEVEQMVRQEVGHRPVEVRIVAGYTGTAHFDESKVKRVLSNLTRNALEAMGDTGRLTVSFERDGGDLLLRVQDTGPGIPPAIAGQLFEAFVTSGKPHGTGLGLAIVRKLVEEHHGSVSFKTKAGKGTVFEVRLPLGAPVPRARRPRPPVHRREWKASRPLDPPSPASGKWPNRPPR